MITKMSGVLVRILDEEVRIEVGPLEYQVLVPETVRRQLQDRLGEPVSLHILEYWEGAAGGNRFVPRRVGFLTELELEFFELFCTVEKIGAKKALKAMARPVAEIAEAISRQDVKWLSTLPGVGAATAEQIVTALKRKVARYAVAPQTPAAADRQLLDDVYQALLSLGHTPADARNRLDTLLGSGKTFRSVEEALTYIYSSGG